MDTPSSNVRSTLAIAGGGTTVEAVAGAGAVVLTILGLVGMSPVWMAAIASIAIGGALILGGASAAVASARTSMPYQSGRSEAIGGASFELIAGGAGIVFGILALLGIMWATLLPIACIVFGGALILGSQNTISNVSLHAPYAGEPGREYLSRDTAYAAGGTEVLIGIGGVVLGILALVGTYPLILVLAAFLSFGVAILFSGGALAMRLFSVMRH